MKAKQMSAILAILIMLSGVLFFAPARAIPQDNNPPLPLTSLYAQGVPATGVTATTDISVQYPFSWVGQPVFNMTIYAENITQCMSLQVGFTFNASIVQVMDVEPAHWFFSNNVESGLAVPSGHQAYYPGAMIDNVNGIVYYYTLGVLGTVYNRTVPAYNTPYPLFMVQFEMNPALTLAYVSSIAGIPQNLMSYSTSASVATTYQTIMTANTPSGLSDISPEASHIANSTITITLPPPHGPTASFTITPNPTFQGTPQAFD